MIMLRLDPGQRRIRTARRFRVWEGGGEYNVARGLAAASVSARGRDRVRRQRHRPPARGLHPPGRRPTILIRWVPCDGIGADGAQRPQLHRARLRRARSGRRVRPRSTRRVARRPGDIDWEHLFGTLGVRWFHTGGIFAALSDTERRRWSSRQSPRPAPRHRRLVRPQRPAEPVAAASAGWSGRER